MGTYTIQPNQGKIKIPQAGKPGNPPATGTDAAFSDAVASNHGAQLIKSSKPPQNQPTGTRSIPTGNGSPKPAPKPQAKPAFDPATSTFGLDVRSGSPFDPLGSPLTTGNFNQEVLDAARGQYLPLLQQYGGDTSAEDAANKERVGDLGSIYNQYQDQAQSAFKEVQSALQGLILQNAGGDANAQANLQAALGSAQGGQGSLAQMMGMSGPGGAQTQPYAAAADNLANITRGQVSSLSQGTLGLEGQNLANVGNERATELNTESLRHGAALQGIQSQRQALIEQIPGIIEKVRQDMISNLQNAESLNFQQQLAGKQFGLSSQQQQFNQGLQAAQFRETQINDAANRRTQQETIDQNAQALRNQQSATQQAAQTALAKAQGKSQADAIKYLTSWLQPSKQELSNKKVTNPDGSTSSQQVLANPKGWHRDVGSALRTIMTSYGIPLDQALSIMEAVGGSTYVSGQGGMTIAEWAYTFRQRAAQRNTPEYKIAHSLTGGLGKLTF